MPTTLFVWELGGGSGHLLEMQQVIDALRGAGHRLFAAVRDVARAGLIWGRAVTCLQAPCKLNPTPAEVRVPHTFAHILHNVGFADAGELAALVDAWRCIFDYVRPDVLVFNHSPTALLAARGLPGRKIVFGPGFNCPPDQTPIRPLRSWLEPDPQHAEDERQLLGRMNQVLAGIGQPPLQRVTQIYGEVDLTCLATFAELDHFGPRPGGRYIGVGVPPGGAAPQWPSGEGPRIFGYLKPFPALPELMRELGHMRCPCLIHGDGIERPFQQRFATPTLRFEERRLDIKQVAQTCDLAILNATHGATASLLLAGKPLLQLPIMLEQGLTSRATCRLGAALEAPMTRGEQVIQTLHQLLGDARYGQGAQRFAAKYADYDPSAASRTLAETIADLARR